MTEPITGVVAPVVTPINEHGDLAVDRVADSVAFTLECGCHAVVASGTGVQETAALAPEERKTLISETVDAVDGRKPVLAGVSYPAQSVVSDLVSHAEDAGVDGLLAMPPWGMPPSHDAIVRYYEAIAAETELPILVYNNPAVTVDMAKETMLAVARIDGVEYVKESSRDWQKVGWLLERIHHAGHAEVFTTMDVLLPTLQAGGSGAVVPAPATVPAMRVYEAYRDGDLETAVRAQRSFGTFPPDEVTTGLTAVCKAATRLSGVDVGPPRPPYDDVGDDGLAAIDAWLDEQDVPTL
uniref:dihydrodipicolinate synthase family protein n=1 Tax=Haloprofundus sp. MHR1 TaxID=2572921 RepID=UPI001F38F1C9|nr:dihydrodipicolinate synthase family protein [Haloprofundus sp. MHR1]